MAFAVIEYDRNRSGAESYRLARARIAGARGSPQAVAQPAAEAAEGAGNGAPEEATNAERRKARHLESAEHLRALRGTDERNG